MTSKAKSDVESRIYGQLTICMMRETQNRLGGAHLAW